MQTKYYSLNTFFDLQSFVNVYLPLVENYTKKIGIEISKDILNGDHLGVQTLSAQEFDEVSNLIMGYSKTIKEGVIHNRRNNIYKFNQPLKYKDIEIPGIEVFEPKPDADIKKLKPGIEHVAFELKDYDIFLTKIKESGFPIDKEVNFDDGSKFFKTAFINLVEIEFRNDSLLSL
jgi:predicted metalloenzyme YecM